VSERSCGDCTLCCTVLRVDELRKLGGVPCENLRTNPPGCGIHATRPRICRRYRCLWLQGKLDEGDRPDRLGAVLDLVSQAGVAHLVIREAQPGAFLGSGRLREIAERFREAVPVRIADGRDATDPDAPFRLLLAGGAERLVAGDRVTELIDGIVVEERLLPPVERLARRVRTRWRAWRQRGYRTTDSR
jgi:hypothetical protein